ncbi:MAG: hypothetical protein IKZ87_00465 [Actinomycetaceae bacterium]|nr:hypothetical protein [Actinomycetaceae bacterium]
MAKLVQHKADFTIVGNSCVRDKSLSYKAIGLLVQLLSVDGENWSFSERGLASLHSDGQASVRSALQELEAAGYLIRERTRNNLGQVGEVVYHVFPEPRTEGIDLGYDGFVGNDVTPENETRLRRSEPKCENRTLAVTSGNAKPVDNFLGTENSVERNRRSEPKCDFPNVENPNVENRSAYKEYKNKDNTNLSFPNGLAARVEVSDEERLGVSGSLSVAGVESVGGAPPGVSETLPADDLAIAADRVQVESLKSSPKDSNVVDSHFTGVSDDVVSDKSPRFHTDSADSGSQSVDWDLLGSVLPRWMFKALNDDVARQSTALVKGALERSWTVEDLREVFISNPKPASMSSPAGLVLSRVKRACAQPAPTLLEPSESLTGASGGGFRDVDRELKKLRGWMDSVGWSRNRGAPYPQRSIGSVDAVLAVSRVAELPDEGTREILQNRLLTLRSLLAREGGDVR